MHATKVERVYSKQFIAFLKKHNYALRWDYSHPAESAEVLCEVGTLPESLQVACQETCKLRLSLDLQMAAWRRDRDETAADKEVRTKLKQKRVAKQKMKATRKR